ncbi:MAG: OB-fold-containig protein [Pseudomonadota bacterium]
MTDLFTPAFAPFTTAIAVLLGLILLEVVMLLIGGSLIGEGEAPEMEAPDLDLPEIEALEFGDVDVEGFEIDDMVPVEGPANMGWTGFGRVPFLIWFASLLVGFGGTGIVVQSIGPAPLWLAVPMAGVAGLAFTRSFSGLFARLIPQIETSVQAERQLARRRGIVTQGTSARGRPAEVKVQDRHGNTHYVRLEPLRADAVITQGQEVLVIHDHRASALRVVALD